VTAPTASLAPLSWAGIVRLGLVQTAIGAIFVLSTATLNRVMVVELALPAALPGALIALHYAMQVLRPRLGHGSDVGGRRTPWIVGGMAVLAAGGLLAAVATGLMTHNLGLGIALAIPAFVLIGLGVGAAGTALLVLIAKRTAPTRRPAAATIAWIMMIIGFIVTAAVAGKMLDPFSPLRLIGVAAAISGIGFVVVCLAVWGVEGPVDVDGAGGVKHDGAFGQAMRDVWDEPRARRFAVFIFVSMLAYGGEELLIEPFAGSLFGMTPGQTAKLSGMLHAGSLAGMVLLAIVGTAFARRAAGSLKLWMSVGCVASAAALLGLAALGLSGASGAIKPMLFALGIANGSYAIAAIGSMMQRVGEDGGAKAGVRMGLWGAAQAVAFGSGGLAATILSDAARHLISGNAGAYALVFGCQAATFFYAALLAARLDRPVRPRAAAGFVAAPRMSRR
jgi:BCD family chlorophyll transporter-like MFS transporter